MIKLVNDPQLAVGLKRELRSRGTIEVPAPGTQSLSLESSRYVRLRLTSRLTCSRGSAVVIGPSVILPAPRTPLWTIRVLIRITGTFRCRSLRPQSISFFEAILKSLWGRWTCIPSGSVNGTEKHRFEEPIGAVDGKWGKGVISQVGKGGHKRVISQITVSAGDRMTPFPYLSQITVSADDPFSSRERGS